MPEHSYRIFVAGEHGQLAKAVGEACQSRGLPVLLAGRSTASVTDKHAITAAIAAFRPDVVINAAAYTAVDRAEDEAADAYRVNRDGVAHLATVCADRRALLVHVSTDYVFDGSKTSPYLETDTPNPLGIYGASKLAGEHAVAAAAVDHLIVRTSWVCSPHGSNFVKTMLRLGAERDEIAVVDDQWGSPTFARDLAATLLTMAERALGSNARSELSGVYHAAGSGYTTWCGFARAIMSKSARRGGPSNRIKAITTSEYPTKAARPANSRLDCSKLERVFGLRLPAWTDSLDICLDELLRTHTRAAI